MSLPAGWELIPTTARYRALDGSIPVGQVAFESRQPVVVDGVIVVPKRILAPLDANGNISVQLPSTDDPDIGAYGGWTYTVRELFPKGRAAYSIVVPYNGGPLDLATVVPHPEIGTVFVPGPPGPAGAAGTDGRTILSGSGAPSNGLGEDGDFYIDLTASDLYGPKAAGAWPAGVSLIGPAGPTGATGAAGSNGTDGRTVLSGSVAPSNGLGADGDFYIDTAASDLYGPKAAGAWPTAVSLIGAAGATGATGLQGPAAPRGLRFTFFLPIDSDQTLPVVVPFAGTITGYTLLAVGASGAVTVDLWRRAAGAVPDSNAYTLLSTLLDTASFEAGGVGDFASTTLAANDVLVASVTAAQGATSIELALTADEA